jgi:glycosyltransferase involved in cell wall biosynthesis
MNNSSSNVGIVVIGRNEGERLVKCLKSLPKSCPVVYIDSASTDASVNNARKHGALCLELDMSIPFTAARARNEGWELLVSKYSEVEYIQFLDGDCELQPNWIEIAHEFLTANPIYVIACGRRRERFPEQTIYNTLCDEEWDTPIGDALACGGDALIKVSILKAFYGYDNSFIAGEEPEFCFRIRQKGHKIMRLDQEMTLHDANITQFSQWWKRTKRGGFAYALGVAKHGKSKEAYNVKNVMRSLAWSLITLTTLVLSIIVTPYFLLMYLLMPLQIARVSLSLKEKSKIPTYSSLFLFVAKFAETAGILDFFVKKSFKKQMKIIEYK